MDLLLYLIRRQHLDILNLPIAKITEQYMEYVELMNQLDLELVAEYLVMAAWLAEIKSRMLLPKPPAEEDEETEDPRLLLIKRLQEYELFKQAAMDLDEVPRLERDHFVARVQPCKQVEGMVVLAPDVALKELALGMERMLERIAQLETHQVSREQLSTREKMSEILSLLKPGSLFEYQQVLKPEEGRRGVVVTLLALLELVRGELIQVMQSEPFGHLHFGLVDKHES